MKTFLLLIFCSFLAGVAISYIPFYRRVDHRLEADFFKGAFIALAALLLVGTPMSLVAAGCGLLFATRCFPYRRGLERKVYGMAAGLLLFMAPDLFLLLLLWCLVLGLLQCSYTEHSLASYFLILPLLMFFTGKSDVYILFGMVLFVIILGDNFEQLATGIHLMIGPLHRGINGGVSINPGGMESAFRKGAPAENPGNRFKVAGLPKTAPSGTAARPPLWRQQIRRLAYMLAALLLFSAFFLNRYVYRGLGMQVEIFRKGPPEAKVVALTFDDGPDPRFTPEILEILAEEEVKATFFMVGKHVDRYPYLARKIMAAGHEIGNHTYNHANLFQALPAHITAEIERGEEAIFKATGQRPSLFRPPRGLCEAKLLEETKDRGYTVVLWSLSSNDWLEMRPVDISRRILQNVTPGDIILFHDSGNIIRAEGGERLPTVRSLKTVLTGLKKEGYDFVTVTELLVLSGLSGDL